jgi:hypothetical protein
MKLSEIAEKIGVYLKRFEKNPKINKLNTKYKTHPYFHANVRQAGNKVAITYVSYQGSAKIDKKEALRYLAWLDAGNVGDHRDCRKDRDFKDPNAGKPECAGCGAVFGARTRRASVLCGTGEVEVCASDRGYEFIPPKKACARKAREKASLCPGCDAPDTAPGTLCSDCADKLDRYSALDDTEVQGYHLHDKLVGPYLGRFRDEDGTDSVPARELLILLCRIAAPEGLRRWAQGGFPDWTTHHGTLGANDSPHSGMPCVELDEGQKSAMLQIGAAIEKLTKAQHVDGLRDGTSVLKRLVGGEMSIRDFNDWQLETERRYSTDGEEE